jgi:hypothetical protein
MRVPIHSLSAVLTVVVLAACEGREGHVARTAATTAVPATPAVAVPASFDPSAWRPPADSEIPRDSLGASIRRGLALLRDTPDSLPAHAPGRIGCANCHLDGGRSPVAAPLAGSHARFPKYMPRSGGVIGLADRVNYCFTRSLAGRRLPHESREMQDILAYLAFLSRGVPVGAASGCPGPTGWRRSRAPKRWPPRCPATRLAARRSTARAAPAATRPTVGGTPPTAPASRRSGARARTRWARRWRGRSARRRSSGTTCRWPRPARSRRSRRTTWRRT